jgi:hypothetical protein
MKIEKITVESLNNHIKIYVLVKALRTPNTSTMLDGTSALEIFSLASATEAVSTA